MSKSGVTSTFWTTSDELEFLADLGKGLHTERGRVTASRQELLRGYRKACEERVVWGRINKDHVMKYLNEAIV